MLLLTFGTRVPSSVGAGGSGQINVRSTSVQKWGGAERAAVTSEATTSTCGLLDPGRDIGPLLFAVIIEFPESCRQLGREPFEPCRFRTLWKVEEVMDYRTYCETIAKPKGY